MIRSNFSQTFELPDLLDNSFEGMIESGFLDKMELSILFMLIRHRRSLPIYHGDYWACYECAFKTTTLGAIAMHIMRAHEPAPLTDEEILESRKLGG
jgi:hypothetical protein